MHDIKFTADALKNARRIATEQGLPEGSPIRVYIDGKGCDGFYYGVAFGTRDDLDLVADQEGLTILCDRESHQFLAGSIVTWVDDERGQGFLVENPNHRKFRGKFYRKKNWQDSISRSATTTSSSQ